MTCNEIYKFYLLKKNDYNKIIMSMQNNSIIVIGSVKQHGAQI